MSFLSDSRSNTNGRSAIIAADKVQSDLDNYQQFVAKKLDVLALDTRPAVATHMNWSSASTRIPAACIA